MIPIAVFSLRHGLNEIAESDELILGERPLMYMMNLRC